jgi:hypothetical protein
MARIAACIDDLFFAAKVKETLTAAGHEVTVVSGQQGVAEGAELLIADLHGPGVLELERPPRVPSLGFYSHVDAETKRRGEDAGFDLVVPRSRMAREMPVLVERLLESRRLL